MIHLEREKLLSFQEAVEYLPGRIALSTLHRWRQNGIRGIKLECCLIGRKRFTSVEALQRFANEVSRADQGTSAAHNSHARSATDATEAKLKALGL